MWIHRIYAISSYINIEIFIHGTITYQENYMRLFIDNQQFVQGRYNLIQAKELTEPSFESV